MMAAFLIVILFLWGVIAGLYGLFAWAADKSAIHDPFDLTRCTFCRADLKAA